MVQMVALKRVRYPRGAEGVERLPGDEFTAKSDKDARALGMLGLAKISEGPMRTAADLPVAALQPAASVATLTSEDLAAPAVPPESAAEEPVVPEPDPARSSRGGSSAATAPDPRSSSGGSSAAVAPEKQDITHLRGTYETVVGKRPFSGWSADELNRRMQAHQAHQAAQAGQDPARYNRRDMQARE